MTFLKAKLILSLSLELSFKALALIMNSKSNTTASFSFIDDLSRGGLWKVSDEMEKIFLITEKYFCINTASKGLRSIPIDTYVDTLMKYSPLYLTYDNIAGSCEISIDDSIKTDILSKLLHLYLRVRSFSLTKDITAKMRQKQLSKRSLRKSIKLASKEEDTK